MPHPRGSSQAPPPPSPEAGIWPPALGQDLKIKTVVSPTDEKFEVNSEAYTGPGKIINSEYLNDLKVPEESIPKPITPKPIIPNLESHSQ